jgi:hypothetical protein
MMKAIFGKLGRKYTTAVLGAGLIVLNRSLDLGLDSETIWQMVAILGSWILGESAIDAAAAVKAFSKTLVETNKPPQP